jgi:hypothetical protein
VWLLAIVAAAAAPLCVRFYAEALQRHARTRTERRLALVNALVNVQEAGCVDREEETKQAGG